MSTALKWIFPLILFGLSCPAADWPDFRGNREHTAIWNEKLPAGLPEQGPPIRWKATIGHGYSGPAVAVGKVVVTDRLTPPSAAKEVERVLCFDEKTGTKLWEYSYPNILKLSGGYENGPRATPVIEKNLVFTLGAMGRLHCLDLQTGEVVWQHDLVKEFGAVIPPWGTVNSPLIDETCLYLQVGGPDAALMAFDKRTGAEKWRSLNGKAGYASMILVEAGRERQLIAWLADRIVSVSARNGQVFWEHPRKLAWDQAVSTPVYYADKNLLLFSSDREGTLALKLDEKKPAASVAWDQKTFASLHTTAVRDGKFAYGIHHNGAERSTCGEFRCLDIETGEVMWSTNTVTRIGIWAHASVTQNKANKIWYITNEMGELILARASPQGYEEIARTQLTGKTWSHPAYANGRIFSRAETVLICADLK